jgi:hypothetical protein
VLKAYVDAAYPSSESLRDWIKEGQTISERSDTPCDALGWRTNISFDHASEARGRLLVVVLTLFYHVAERPSRSGKVLESIVDAETGDDSEVGK